MSSNVELKNRSVARVFCLLIAAAVLGALALSVSSSNCYGKESSSSPSASDEDARIDKDFDKSLNKKSFPWYSSKEKSVRFLPKKEGKKGREPELLLPEDIKPPKVDAGDFLIKAFGVWLPIALLVVVVAVLAWLGVRAYLARNERRRFSAEELLRRKRRIETLAEEARARYDDLDKAAEEALARGDLRSALVFYFSWILVEMDKRSAVQLDKGKTNLEYWRELEERPRLRELYRSVMIEFERVYFGGRPIGRSEFDAVWTLREPFAEMMREEDERKLRLEQEREEAKRRAAEKKWQSPKTMTLFVAALVSVSLLSGCSRYWRDEYAGQGGYAQTRSLNGTEVFYDYCQRQCGDRVRTLYSHWNAENHDAFAECDTIVWFSRSPAYGRALWSTAGASPSSRPRPDSTEENPHNVGFFQSRTSFDDPAFKALTTTLKRYADAGEEDWTTFCVPASNGAFYNAQISWTGDRSDYKSSQDRIRAWLKEKPGRKCVVVLTDQDSEWDYWRASREDIVRRYEEPERSRWLKESEENLKTAARGGGRFSSEDFMDSYRTPPDEFVASAKREMVLRAKEAQKLQVLFSLLKALSTTIDPLETVDSLRRRRDVLIDGRSLDPDEIFEKMLKLAPDAETRGKNDSGTPDASGEIVFDENESDVDELFSGVYWGGQNPFSVDDITSKGFDFGDDWENRSDAGLPEFWFRQEFVEFSVEEERPEASFSGDPSWTAGLPEKARSHEQVRLVPMPGTETLLALGDSPLVCRRPVEEGEIVFVNSSSFLSNYGLVDPVNRRIANRLVREFNPSGNIGILSANDFGYYPKVNDEASRRDRYKRRSPEGRFTLTKASPFTVFVWHAAALAAFLGFCAWPIFGRARRVARDDTSDFGMHVDAMAQLLKKGDSVAWAREQIDACRRYRRRGRTWGHDEELPESEGPTEKNVDHESAIEFRKPEESDDFVPDGREG